jgi:predicted RNase H-like HicB family nuclease
MRGGQATNEEERTMATTYYPAIIERGIDGFGVYFPDLPGCVSAGVTEQEAALGAEEALNGHLAVMAEYGDAIPNPSALGGIVAAEGSDEVGRILVRGERPGRAVRVQVSIEEGLLARIDRVAKNRSRFLADAARVALAATAS